MQASTGCSTTSSEISVRGDVTAFVRGAKAMAGLSCPRATQCDVPVTISIVDDNAAVRRALRQLFEQNGYTVECYASGAEFLAAHVPGRRECLLLAAILPGISGIELIRRLRAAGDDTPAVVMSGSATVVLAVQAIKAGAFDVLEIPFHCDAVLASVDRALVDALQSAELGNRRRKSAVTIAQLTRRQRQILDLVLAGHPSKNIAADLGISQRSVENHRAAIMRKTGSKSLAGLVQTVICARCIADQRNGIDACIAASPRIVAAIEHARISEVWNETPMLVISRASNVTPPIEQFPNLSSRAAHR